MTRDDNRTPNPVEKTFEVLSGKWKPLIIYHLKQSKKRFTEIYEAIPRISKRMLTKHLREMEEDKLVVRIVYPEVPPRVEYHLSDHGLSLLPLLDSVVEWGKKYLQDLYDMDPEDMIPPTGS